MTYTINVSGSKTVADAEEGKTFEEDVAAKAREFVASLEGVHVANITGNQIGSVDLREAS